MFLLLLCLTSAVFLCWMLCPLLFDRSLLASVLSLEQPLPSWDLFGTYSVVCVCVFPPVNLLCVSAACKLHVTRASTVV